MFYNKETFILKHIKTNYLIISYFWYFENWKHYSAKKQLYICQNFIVKIIYIIKKINCYFNKLKVDV